jgi:hypothetical protein
MSTLGTFELGTPLRAAGPATVYNTSLTHAASSATHASGVPVGGVVLGAIALVVVALGAVAARRRKRHPHRERGQHRGPRA